MTATPPGWYTDPENPSLEHWWDGTSYTQTRPRPAIGYAGPVSPKSRLVASLLSFFLGGLGVDRFYLGNIGMGVAKLLVGWATLGIWPLVDFIIVIAGAAHDGDGLPVRDWQA